MRLILSRFKIPRSLEAAADMYYALRERRYAIQADAANYLECEAKLRSHFNATLSLDRPQIVGSEAKVKLVPKVGIKITDWARLHEYIRRYDAFDILQRKVNEDVIKKLWSEGKEVPGTEPAPYNDVSAVKR